MEAAIKQRTESKAPQEVTAIVLDELKFKEINLQDAKVLAEYVQLDTLSCNRTGLHSLANLPPLPKLTTLELTDNFINDSSSIDTLTQYSELGSLSLSGNKLKSVEDLKSLAGLTKLINLELELNPLTESDPKYRVPLFALIPSLKIIDNQDREGNEMELDSSDDEDEEADRKERQNIIRELYEKDMSDDEEDDEEYNPIAEEAEESSDSSDDPDADEDEDEEMGGESESIPAKLGAPADPEEMSTVPQGGCAGSQ